MPYITNQEIVFCVKEVVVFEVCCHQGMNPGLTGIIQ